jgi:hypothetical protein
MRSLVSDVLETEFVPDMGEKLNLKFSVKLGNILELVTPVVTVADDC